MPRISCLAVARRTAYGSLESAGRLSDVPRSRQQRAERELIDDGFASVAEAARWLAISRSRMYELLRGNVISHATLGGKLVVSRRALHSYALSTLKVGSVA